MREIKFRAWIEDVDEEEKPFMSKPFTLLNLINGHHEFWDDEGFGYLAVEDIDDWSKITFLQFTGLKDSKGKEIYEGDILDYRSECGAYHVVKWLVLDNGIGLGCDCSGFLYMSKTEIVGNIYENKNFLRKTDKHNMDYEGF